MSDIEPCLLSELGDQKRTHTLLIRVEKSVEDFYKAEARRRRVSVSQIVRELLYQDMAAKKGATKKE